MKDAEGNKIKYNPFVPEPYFDSAFWERKMILLIPDPYKSSMIIDSGFEEPKWYYNKKWYTYWLEFTIKLIDVQCWIEHKIRKVKKNGKNKYTISK